MRQSRATLLSKQLLFISAFVIFLSCGRLHHLHDGPPRIGPEGSPGGEIDEHGPRHGGMHHAGHSGEDGVFPERPQPEISDASAVDESRPHIELEVFVVHLKLVDPSDPNVGGDISDPGVDVGRMPHGPRIFGRCFKVASAVFGLLIGIVGTVAGFSGSAGVARVLFILVIVSGALHLLGIAVGTARACRAGVPVHDLLRGGPLPPPGICPLLLRGAGYAMLALLAHSYLALKAMILASHAAFEDAISARDAVVFAVELGDAKNVEYVPRSMEV